MKSEHRHELAENDLSKLLAKWGQEFDKHANAILSVLIVVTLIAAGVIYWTRTSAATSALGWTDLAAAQSAEDFQNVAEDYSGTPVAQWATLRAADGFLREGIRLSLTDRPASDERLAQARESYEALLNNTGAPAEIREQALMGYAVTLESVSDGDTSEAVSAYEKLLEEFPETRFESYANDRISDLKTGGAQDFYAWYSRLNPKPADLPGPQDQPKLPSASDLSNLLPELGGAGIPETAPFNIPGSDEAPADEDANPFAEEEMKQDAPETPAADNSAPEAPPEDSKPKPDAEADAKEADTKDASKPAETDTPEEPAKDEETPQPEAEKSSESKPDEPATDEPVSEEPAADESATQAETDGNPVGDDAPETGDNPASDEAAGEDESE